jgi:antitoxin component of RelBE/YafQ-DinJ toxin-antitoxin module
MTYFSIDTKSKQAKKMVELLETLPFAKILDEPNALTKKAMKEAESSKGKKHKSAKDLITFLSK